MINITTTQKSIHTHDADSYVFFALQKSIYWDPISGTTIERSADGQEQTIELDLQEFSQQYIPQLPEILTKSGFTGKPLEVSTIPFLKDGKLVYVHVVGLGKSAAHGNASIERFRRAVATGIRVAIKSKSSVIALALPNPKDFDVDIATLTQELALIITMTMYHFDTYITDAQRKEVTVTDVIVGASYPIDTYQSSLNAGIIIGQAVNKTRHWIDLPPMVLTPPILAQKGLDIAEKYDTLTAKVFTEPQIIEMGMGGLAAVSAGSDVECRLLIMEYKARDVQAPTIAFVGKGITFDSGGLSIKPADSMETMKDDMSGAAAVIAVMEALAQLQPLINVIGVAPMSENLPSGTAIKPGDIVYFYNGKTAEIKNTDAEGRLILADALSYTVKKYKLDAIIDIATLTGACAYALGHFYTGLLSQHEDLVAKLQHAGNRTGDKVWRLPMDDDYKPAIKTPVADICNIGNRKYMAGAITAAFFLQNFVDSVPWAHLDIAGSSYDVPDIPYFRTGASGAGVRLLIDLAMQWK